ncbi:MAG: hypothetical protein ABIV51_04520 [Saprospiraceae bacterium]
MICNNLLPFKMAFCLLSVLFCQQLSAQDTTFLKTFKYGSSSRSGVFQFPDINPDSLERIILAYNMRCLNGAAGGCGEWDYSCNTYVTDSTRLDSTPASQK